MLRHPALLLGLLSIAVAQNSSNTSSDGFPNDPILDYRPVLARSLPIQLLLNGIVLTLTAVLLLQLLFTAQYHFRLAPINFSLQISAVCTLLVSSISTVHVVMEALSEESSTWPYMLNYVAVDIPPDASSGWTMGQLGAWLLMTATTGMLIQITHIQFLTLLFPSKLEKRLIIVLLGPLAVVSAVMQMLRVVKDAQRAVVAVQNVCNATLSLLFTAALFVWGLLVNRKNAWRTDGGTASFGVGALTLAPLSTAISLLSVPLKDEFTWMKPLMWSVILWQSFLGWWWWVGAGMGVGDLEELLSRTEKRQNGRKRRSARRRGQRERAETIWKGVTDAFGFGRGDAHETQDETRTSSSAASASALTSTRGVWRRPYAWFAFLRREHLAATREQAVEWVERVNEVYGREEGQGRGSRGWGLGQYAIRRVEEAADNETVVGDEDVDVVDDDEGVDQVERGEDGRRKGGDAEMDGDEGKRRMRRRNRRRDDDNAGEAPAAQPPEASPSSMWWWGPLRRWRLHDVTEY
ncbi:uncharacterized protein FIBRA_06071 [Fibroporia radiculosa]|uniref:Uncharacterized protein n=1 Tax=Fibroporia radiculosa TaxID=599839 RepID=J4GS54_9APHY|nr:uncharacterized protein FIBRA_06071 [Fibroporia radiculosa]CCM03920.1 predicted protein [Fibroporia radiculosa]